MQSFKLLLITVLSISSLFANAKTKNETIKVWGNCGMCETRIERAAKDVGASSADWNADTKILTVSFDEAKTSLSTIETKLASVGHDTKNKTASKDAYSKLPGCCQYERKETSSASVSCCVAGVSCCSSGQACCTKTTSTIKSPAADCCVSGVSCCIAGAACCNKTAKVVSISASDCCPTGGECCIASQVCCAKTAA